MKIGRNRQCPCMSGKKFKRCCMDDPKHSSTQLNNSIHRKYMSEFALHTFSSYASIAYPNLLDTINVSEASYHIYMINKIKRLSFVEDSIKVFKNHIELQIRHGITSVEKITTLQIPRHKMTVDFVFEGNKTLFMKDGHGGGVKADILYVYSAFSTEPLDCEVLYIGQSYGKEGNRDALTRLRSHETLQKIMADVSHEDINSEIAITVWEFTPRLITSFDGRNGFLVSTEEDEKHLKKVLSAPPLYLDSQIVNVTEAALINYYKPKYNEKFKNNFPDIGHKGYKFYYDYDYNAILVELDQSAININMHSDYVDYHDYSHIKYLLNTEEKRKSMFTL